MCGLNNVFVFVCFKYSFYSQSTRSLMEKSRSEKVFEVISLSSSFFDVGLECDSIDYSDLTFFHCAK